MLKITPYLGILVLIVSIAGLWFPILGYFMLVVFAALLLISPFRGRWFCGNLCPRGSLNDFLVGKITKNKKIPETLKTLWLRVPVFAALMGFMGFRIMQTQGLINQIGMVFVVMCLVTTSIAVVLGISISPRTWCSFCPMGTAQRILGGNKYQLDIDEDRCISCKKCDKSCPMHLKVHKNETKPDCIKCERCVYACPNGAIDFQD